MKKTLIIIISIILVITLGIVIGIYLNKDDTSKPVYSNSVKNILSKNEINNTAENVIENNENSNTINIEEESKEEKQAEEPKTDLEKAIDIVKKDWGKDDTVYFSKDDDRTPSGEYRICVRDKNTTSAKARYTVNVSTGKFEKDLEEMR